MARTNVETIRHVYDLFARRRQPGVLDEVAEVWHGDALWRPALVSGGSLEGEVFEGADGIEAFFARADETWSELIAQPVEIRAIDEHRVLARVALRATGRASGVEVAEESWVLFVLRDGKVADARSYSDERGALVAAGQP